MAFDDALADIRSALSADPQQTAQAPATASTGPDAVLADLAKSPEQLRAEIGTPAKPGGVAHNLGAGINDFLAGGLGAPVDAATWALNKGAQGINALTGTNLGEIRN